MNHWGVILAIVSVIHYSVSQGILGVEPERQHLYKPIDETSSTKKWRCLSDPSIIIDYSQINDDVCDCPDGSDEIGTNACQDSSFRFYCANEGHIPGFIESFKLNDGVCDYDICCDGSDEYATRKCPNKCKEVHEQFLEHEAKLKRDSKEALIVKNTLRSEAQEQRQSLKDSLRDLEEQRVSLLRKRKLIEEEANRVEDEDIGEDSYLTKELSEHVEALMKKVQRKQNFHENTLSRIEELEQILSSLTDNHYNIEDSVNRYKEYEAKYENIKDEDLDIESSMKKFVTYLKSSASRTNANSNVPTLSGLLQYYFPYFASKDSDQAKARLAELREKAILKKQTKAAASIEKINSQLSPIESEMEIVEEDLNAEYGEDDIFRPVKFKWFKKTINGYKYNVGLLDSIYQDDILLGRFSELDGNIMSYKHGTKCWNGPNRSAKVELVCGEEQKLVAVMERQKCEYFIQLQSPIACQELNPEYINASFKIDYDRL